MPGTELGVKNAMVSKGDIACSQVGENQPGKRYVITNH